MSDSSLLQAPSQHPAPRSDSPTPSEPGQYVVELAAELLQSMNLPKWPQDYGYRWHFELNAEAWKAMERRHPKAVGADRALLFGYFVRRVAGNVDWVRLVDMSAG